MQNVVLVLLIVLAVVVSAGFVPCLGWLNWIGTPLAFLVTLLGLIGLVSDRDPEGHPRGLPLYLTAMLGGVVLGGLGAMRCLLGGGML